MLNIVVNHESEKLLTVKPEELSVNDLDYNVVYYINTEINQKYYILVTDGNNDYLINLMSTNYVMVPTDSVNGETFYKCKSVTIFIDR